MKPVRVPTADEIRRFPVTVDVPTAGRCWGLGRKASYRAARDGTLPVKVLTLAGRRIVTRAALMAALGIADEPSPAPGTPHASTSKPLVAVPASDNRSDATAPTEAA